MPAIVFTAVKGRLAASMRGAVTAALEEMEEDARKHAPVRDVFRGGRRPGERLFAERGVRRIRKGLQEQQEFLDLVKKQRPKDRRYYLAQTDQFGFPTGESRRESGNSRSYDPIVRDLSEEIYRGAYGFPRRGTNVQSGGESFGGSLRDVTGFTVEGRDIRLPRRAFRGPAELGEFRGFSARELPPSVIATSAHEFLSSKGLSELKRQSFLTRHGFEGRNAPFHTNRAGDVTFGGRLRDEIHSTRVRDSGKSFSGWVVSPTPYAKFQEYGTSRHRAQPYMRPALYRMRQRFPTIVKSWLGRRVA